MSQAYENQKCRPIQGILSNHKENNKGVLLLRRNLGISKEIVFYGRVVRGERYKRISFLFVQVMFGRGNHLIHTTAQTLSTRVWISLVQFGLVATVLYNHYPTRSFLECVPQRHVQTDVKSAYYLLMYKVPLMLSSQSLDSIVVPLMLSDQSLGA